MVAGAIAVAMQACGRMEVEAVDTPPPTATVKACKKSSDCPSGPCIPRIGEAISDTVDGVCATPCASTNDCIAGWSCLAGPTGADVCQCRASAEACDGLDNDCDGLIDNHPFGVCTCTKTVCNDRCVDTDTDARNCGRCDNPCTPATTCKGGVCSCPAGRTLCGTACLDLQSDAKNCGACAKVCNAGSLCDDGQCRCGVGGVVCAGAKACDLVGECHGTQVIPVDDFVINNPFSGAAVGDRFIVVSYKSGASTYVTRTPFAGSSNPRKVVAGAPSVAADGEDWGYGLVEFGSQHANVYACLGTSCTAVAPGHEGRALQIHSGSLYWIGADTLRRCPLSGCNGTPEDLAASPPAGSGVTRLRVDGTGAYGVFGDVVAKWTEASAVWETMFTLTGATTLGVDATTVYAANPTSIVSCPKSGCGGTAAAVVTGTSVLDIAVLGPHVFWRTDNPWDLMRCPKASSCTPQKLRTAMPLLLGENALELFFAGGAPGNKTSVTRYSK